MLAPKLELDVNKLFIAAASYDVFWALAANTNFSITVFCCFAETVITQVAFKFPSVAVIVAVEPTVASFATETLPFWLTEILFVLSLEVQTTSSLEVPSGEKETVNCNVEPCSTVAEVLSKAIAVIAGAS